MEIAARLPPDRAAHTKKALTNSPGPSHPFFRVESEKKISNSLTIANVRGRLKMNTFCDF